MKPIHSILSVSFCFSLFAITSTAFAFPLTCNDLVQSLPSTQAFVSQDLAKYNESRILHFRFTPRSLEMVKAMYHQLPVPKIVEDILQMKDPDSTLLIKQTPQYFRWNPARDTFISVNPTYTPAKSVVEAVRSGQVRHLKDQSNGIALITWFAHPALKQQVSVARSKNEDLRPQKISALEKEGERYLVSILDLQRTDVNYLKELKRTTLQYLGENFGVVEGRDDIRLDFHFPYAVKTSTLHLHARVNMPSHPLELSKSYHIDEVIAYLEAGKSVADLILDRQQKLGGFYFSNDSRALLESLDPSALNEVQNPFLQSLVGEP